MNYTEHEYCDVNDFMRMGCPVGPSTIYDIRDQVLSNDLEEFKDIFLSGMQLGKNNVLFVHKEKLLKLIEMAKEYGMVSKTGRIMVKKFIKCLVKKQSCHEVPTKEKPLINSMKLLDVSKESKHYLMRFDHTKIFVYDLTKDGAAKLLPSANLVRCINGTIWDFKKIDIDDKTRNYLWFVNVTGMTFYNIKEVDAQKVINKYEGVVGCL